MKNKTFEFVFNFEYNMLV